MAPSLDSFMHCFYVLIILVLVVHVCMYMKLFLSFQLCIYFYCSFVALFLQNKNSNIFLTFLQYVVVPTRRSTAEAFQILISHALGDAGSPYLVGVVSVILIIYVLWVVIVVLNYILYIKGHFRLLFLKKCIWV